MVTKPITTDEDIKAIATALDDVKVISAMFKNEHGGERLHDFMINGTVPANFSDGMKDKVADLYHDAMIFKLVERCNQLQDYGIDIEPASFCNGITVSGKAPDEE